MNVWLVKPDTERALESKMGVVQAKIQTVEDIYRLVRVAIVHKQPIGAVYDGLYREFCPHRLGRNRDGEDRVLCYQFGGKSRTGLEPSGSAANWRCIVPEKLSKVELLEHAWHTAPNHSRPQSCVVDVDVDVEDYPHPHQDSADGR